jgi:hypothetical protein
VKGSSRELLDFLATVSRIPSIRIGHPFDMVFCLSK